MMQNKHSFSFMASADGKVRKHARRRPIHEQQTSCELRPLHITVLLVALTAVSIA